MFSNLNKPTFGAGPTNTSFGFGTQTPNANPFAQNQLFNKPGTTPGGFGSTSTSTFGQPGGASLFPGQQQSNLFQNANTSTFGTPASGQTGFGTTNLFGQQQAQPSTSGLFAGSTFGQQNKPSGFGFGTPQQSTIFGQQQQQTQQQGSALFQPTGSTNIFGQSSTFGPSTSGQTGTVIKFNPVTGSDTMQKSGVATTISTKHHCITCMKEYEGKSLEELRYEDYLANRKGPQQQSGFGAAPFGAPVSSAPSLFGQTDNKSAFGQTTGFGQTTSSFGQPNTAFGLQNQQNTAGTLFGKPTTGFGTPASNSFGFGTNTTTNVPFGQTQQAKPFGTTTQPLFGTTPATQPSGFGTGLFGQTGTQPTTTTSTLFQTPKPATGFGLFGQTPTTNTGFGQTNTFGQQQSAFGASSFAKPAGQTFTPSNQTFGSTFSTGLQQPGSSLFSNVPNKPGGLFGSTGTGGGLFSGSAFQQPATAGFNMQPQQPTMSFPAVEASDISIIASSQFPISPHLQGLLPVHPSNYTTNPAELKSILETTNKINTTTPKLKVTPIKESIFAHLFDDMPSSPDSSYLYERLPITNQKRLIIKNTAEKNDSIFSDTDDDLIAEIEKCRKKSPEITPQTEDMPILRSRSSTVIVGGNIGGGDIGDSTERDPKDETPAIGRKLVSDLRISDRSDFPGIRGGGDENKSKQTDKESAYAPEKDRTNLSQKDKSLVLSPSPRPSISRRESSQSPPRSTFSRLKDFSVNTSVTTSTPITSKTELKLNKELPKADKSKELPKKKYACGVILERPEYYTVPPVEQLDRYLNDDGSCIIKGFTVGRVGYGNVYFPDPIDVSNLNLDDLVYIRHREITIYPDDDNKPPLNHELNRRAQVTLDHVYPKMKDSGEEIRDVDTLLKSDFIDKLKEVSERQGTKFLEYRPETGSWVFDVEHFSKYGFGAEENNVQIEKRQEQDQQKKQGQHQPQKQLTLQSEPMEVQEGLGGIEDSTSILDLSTKVSQEMIFPGREVELLRCAFYESPEHVTFVERLPMEHLHYFDQIIDVVDDQILAVEPMSPQQSVISYSTPDVSIMENIGGRVPPEESLLKGLRSYMDMKTFRHLSFKCGWMKGFNNFMISKEIYTGRHMSSILYQNNVLHQQCVYDMALEILDDIMDIAHSETICKFDSNGIPTFNMKQSSSYLVKQTEIFMHMSRNSEELGYFSSIWELCYALWAPLEYRNQLRRQRVSNWLKKTVDRPVVDDAQLIYGIRYSFKELGNIVLQLLSIYDTYKASEVLMAHDCPQLAILITQLNTTEEFRQFLQQQIVEWYKNITEEFLNIEMKRFYLLLSGNALLEDVNVCEGLDWKRAFGMHLWYVTSAHETINEGLRVYTEAFDCDVAYAAKPYPPYAFKEGAVSDSTPEAYDILYHILKLYCEQTYVLNKVLNPPTHTNDPLDYRMSWLLLQLFHSLNVGVIDENSETMITTSFATQLENMDKWEWAVYVLMFLKDNTLKKQHVIGVLQRNLSTNVNQESINIEKTLIDKLKVPQEWVYLVKAQKSAVLGEHWNSFTYFAYAGDYYKSNDIFVSHLLADMFIDEKYEELKVAVKPLYPYCNSITSWCYEIGLVLDYLELEERFRQPVKKLDIGKLHSALLVLIGRLPNFPSLTSAQKLCIAELSRKCALLQRILSEKVEHPSCRSNFAKLIPDLIMPPDYTLNEALYYLLKLLE